MPTAHDRVHGGQMSLRGTFRPCRQNLVFFIAPQRYRMPRSTLRHASVICCAALVVAVGTAVSAQERFLDPKFLGKGFFEKVLAALPDNAPVQPKQPRRI